MKTLQIIPRLSGPSIDIYVIAVLLIVSGLMIMPYLI